jgi:hypothetical protein
MRTTKILKMNVSWSNYIYGCISSDFANMSHLNKLIIYIIAVNIFSILLSERLRGKTVSSQLPDPSLQ